jgi:long-chain fatty acid transport protein
MKKNTNLPFSLITIAVSLASSVSFASGFSLYNEINGAAVGNYAAGIAADYSDASIGWSNPAGLSFINHDQVVLGAVGVFPHVSLNGNTSYITQLPIEGFTPLTFNESFTNLQGATKAGVPFFHFAHPLGPTTTFGLSIVSPYGLATDWGNDSPLRYEATYTKLLTLDVSPEIGGRFNEHLTGGIGLDLEQAYVTFNQVLGSPALMGLFDLPPTLLDSSSVNKGSSFGVGFHAGLLAHFNEEHSRIGINYQSPVSHQFSGTSQLTGRLADSMLNVFDPLASNSKSTFLSDQLYSNVINLPGVTTLSGYQDINNHVAILGSVIYTGWSSFKEIQLFNVAALTIDETGQVIPAYINALTPENYRDTWRFSLGTNLKISEQFMLRLGTGFEQTPTVDVFRDVRLPDANRWAASVGGHYQLNKIVGFDAGYSHYFMDNPSVNKTDLLHTSQFHIQANGEAFANLVGAQVVLTLD